MAERCDWCARRAVVLRVACKDHRDHINGRLISTLLEALELISAWNDPIKMRLHARAASALVAKEETK